MTYLDNAATSFPKAPECASAISRFILESTANPGRGNYKTSVKATEMLQHLRIGAAALFGIDDPMRIAIVPSSTYGLNTAIHSIFSGSGNTSAVISPMEHNAVTRPLWKWCNSIILSGGDGMLMDPIMLSQNLLRLRRRGKKAAIVVTLSSNITGHVNDICGISSVAAEYGCPLVLDASQGAGIVDICVRKLPRLDYMAIPGHKGLMGPQGTGLLYVSPGAPVSPLMFGGTGSGTFDSMTDVMPDVLECGTINSPGVAGLIAAVEYVSSIGPKRIQHHKNNMCHLFASLLKGNSRILPLTDRRFPNSGIYSFNIKGMDSQSVARILDSDYGISVRGGFHCSPLGHRSLGTSDVGAVRVSPGVFTTEKEMQYAAESILHIASKVV